MPHPYLEMVQAQRVPTKHIQINHRPCINRRMLRHKVTTIQIMQTPKLQTVPIIRRQQIRIIPITKGR